VFAAMIHGRPGAVSSHRSPSKYAVASTAGDSRGANGAMTSGIPATTT